MTEFRRPDGQTAPAYHTEPEAGTSAPGLVVIQEWWGINPQMKGIAERFAQAGFRTVVPDLYRGRLASDADEANHMMTGLDWQDATFQDLQGAVDHLRAGGSSKVAVLGFCMGGALTVAASVHTDGIDGGVCFYGIPPKELADPAKARVPLLLHFASDDAWCSDERQAQLRADLESSGTEFTMHRYEGTQHAFMNEARPEVYDAAAAELAWERSVAWLGQKLG